MQRSKCSNTSIHSISKPICFFNYLNCCYYRYYWSQSHMSVSPFCQSISGFPQASSKCISFWTEFDALLPSYFVKNVVVIATILCASLNVCADVSTKKELNICFKFHITLKKWKDTLARHFGKTEYKSIMLKTHGRCYSVIHHYQL